MLLVCRVPECHPAEAAVSAGMWQAVVALFVLTIDDLCYQHEQHSCTPTQSHTPQRSTTHSWCCPAHSIKGHKHSPLGMNVSPLLAQAVQRASPATMAEAVTEGVDPPTKRARYAGLPVPSNQPMPCLNTEAAVAPPPGLCLPANAAELLPHLQRLYSMYKVEYWSLLEELQTQYQGVGGSELALEAEAAPPLQEQGPAQHTAAMAQGWDAGSGMRMLMHAARLANTEVNQHKPGAQVQLGGAVTGSMTELQQPQQLPEVDPMAACQGTAALSQPQQLGKEVAVPAIHGAESAPQAADPGTPAAPAAVPYSDDIVGYGSDDDPDTFTDVEDAIIGAEPGGQAASAEVLARRRQGIAAARGSVLELERLASAVSAQYLDAQGALACLCGRNGRYLLRRIVCSIGRGSDSKGEMEVDLAREGPAAKVSRCQAQLTLQDTGAWRLQNVGRRALTVNDVQLTQGQGTDLPHLSLVEVGGIRLLFLVNPAAVKRVLARSRVLEM